MKQSEEIWKPITNYEGLYEVSNNGNVRSIPRVGTHSDKPTNISPHLRTGYFHVTLWKNGKQKNHTVHRLVATMFIPNPENLPVINHKDEVKTNNKAENLEWCSHKYNYNYSNVAKRVVEVNGHKIKAFQNGKYIGEYRSIREAGRCLGLNPNSIRRSLQGGKIRSNITFKRI